MNAFVEAYPHRGATRSMEGPSDFAKRAAPIILPNESERVRQITETYIALRYAPGPAAISLDKFAKEMNAFTAHR